MTPSTVDANTRFMAGYHEVNARIAQRQHALALHVTLVVGLLAALVAFRPSAGTDSPPIEWLILGFPAASICFAFLNYKAELALTNLRTFLAELERLGEAHRGLPSYNADPRWSQSANKARRFHDYAAAVLVAGGNLIGLGSALAIHPARMAAAPVFLLVAALLAAGSFVIVLLTARSSYTLR